MPAAVGKVLPKLTGEPWLTAEASLPEASLPAVGVGLAVALAAATNVGVTKLKVLGKLAPAALGPPPKEKVVTPLGGATGGEGVVVPNEKSPFPTASGGATDGGGG